MTTPLSPSGSAARDFIAVGFEEGGDFSMTGGDSRNEGIYEVIDPQPPPNRDALVMTSSPAMDAPA